MSRDHPGLSDTHCTDEHPYTLMGCALGNHYNVVQWFHLACNLPAMVSLKMLTPTKPPRATSCAFWCWLQPTQTFSTRRIPRALLNPHHQLVHQDKFLPHTMPDQTHIGSWLYCFHGWSRHELVLRFGYDN
jgi:hypothetical protein